LDELANLGEVGGCLGFACALGFRGVGPAGCFGDVDGFLVCGVNEERLISLDVDLRKGTLGLTLAVEGLEVGDDLIGIAAKIKAVMSADCITVAPSKLSHSRIVEVKSRIVDLGLGVWALGHEVLVPLSHSISWRWSYFTVRVTVSLRMHTTKSWMSNEC
jgi:hypothetical protein